MTKTRINNHIAVTAFSTGRNALRFSNQKTNLHAVNVVIPQLRSVSIETIEGPDKTSS